MEPLLPGAGNPRLPVLALALIRGAERLGASLHPITCKMVADLVRSMNSYYSNLIEGHRTRPRDIDAALRKDFSTNPAQRALQIQHVAHIEVQAEMEARLDSMPASGICSVEFFCWLHGGFQKVTRELLWQRLMTSSSPKGSLRLGFPADAAGYYFPNLYPAGADGWNRNGAG